MLFQKSLIGNSRVAAEQWREVVRTRECVGLQEQMFVNNGLQTNAGLVPRDVYQEWDSSAVTRWHSDDGDVYLNDLLPSSRSVSIGTLISKFRMTSDAGVTQTSMTGQIGIKMDQVSYTYDGALVPIHDTGFYRNWREWSAMSSEGFDALIDDQREHVGKLRERVADSFLDGHKDSDGNLITLDGTSWAGLRSDNRVAQINIGASGVNVDFTATGLTGDQLKLGFIQIRDVMWITNKCERPITYYVSREIASNFERKFSAQYDARSILQELAGLMGVAGIKVSSKLTGNQIMGFPTDGEYLHPVVGMGINTVAMPRPVYNSNYEFAVWGAIGWKVKNDFAGNTCVFYASDLG